MPVDLGQRGGVAGGQRVGGEHQVGAGHRGRRTACPSARSAPWWTCTRSAGRELARPPAASCRPATSGRPAASAPAPASPSRGSSGEQLDRLAQAHVVGQDRAEPERLEEGQPGQAALLVRAQRAGEAGRRRHRLEPALGLAGEQVAERAVGGRPPRPAGPPGPSSVDSPAWSRSATVICAGRWSSSFRPAASRLASSSTHWPRSRTSGALSSVSAVSSSSVSGSSPRASCHW